MKLLKFNMQLKTFGKVFTLNINMAKTLIPSLKKKKTQKLKNMVQNQVCPSPATDHFCVHNHEVILDI